MVKTGPVLYILGLILLALSVGMVATAGLDAFFGEDQAGPFLFSGFISAFAGGALVAANRSRSLELDPRQAFVLTFLSWSVSGAFAALPFVFWRLDYADAFFEAISGLTTTGSTVIAGLDDAPRAILLWRSILQGLGGIGIIVMAIAILPFLRVGGMQLFKTESTEKVDKVLPRPGQIAAATAQIFVVLTFICAVAYILAGMPPFDAFNHALTSVATGGYSTHDQSLGYYEDKPAVQWIAIAFMCLGALPFVLYVKMMQGQPLAVLSNSQVQVFFAILFGAWAIVTTWLLMHDNLDLGFEPAARHAAFTLVSTLTTTGYASTDYMHWVGACPVAIDCGVGEACPQVIRCGTGSALPLAVIFALIFIGGCSGSTSSGIKAFRLQIVWIALRMQVQKMIHPHAITPRQYTGIRLSDDVIASVLIYVAVHVLTVAVLAIALAATGLEFVTALSGAAQAISNIGPGLGSIIGPAGTYAGLPDAAKWLLSFGMLLGRLELMTVFVLFTPVFWRG